MHPFVPFRHSVAVMAWSGIDLSALFEIPLETLHVLSIVVDSLIYYAPTIINRLGIWRIWGSACVRDKIWQVSIAPCVSVRSRRTAACHSAPHARLRTLFHLVRRRSLALLRRQTNSFEIRKLKQILWMFIMRLKKEHYLILQQRNFLSCLENLRHAAFLSVSSGFLLLPKRPPPFRFPEPLDGALPVKRGLCLLTVEGNVLLTFSICT